MRELNIVEKVIALEAVDLLKNLTPDQLSRIASIAKEVSYGPGATILEPAKSADALYVILDGAVEIATRRRGRRQQHRAFARPDCRSR